MKFAAFLRDAFDGLCSRRRDISLKDFDWRRCFRLYQQNTDPKASVESSVSSFGLSIEPVRFQVFDDVFPYGNEFYGIHQTLNITPTTEKMFLSIWLGLSVKRPVLLQGNDAVGKRYTINVKINETFSSSTFDVFIFQSLARFLGRFIATFECSQHIDANATAMFVTGLSAVRFCFFF